MALRIIAAALALVIYIAGGFVCGMISAEIIEKKNTDYNKSYWFWAGFLFNVLAVFMTLCVKEKKN